MNNQIDGFAYPSFFVKWWRNISLAANLIAFSGVINKIFTAEPRYMPKYPSAR